MRILATLLLLFTLAACADDPSSGPYVGGGVGGNRRDTSFR